MQNYTYPQLALAYENIKKVEFDNAEQLGRLVWAIANGWEKPKNLAEGITDLKDMGMYEEK